MKEVLLRKYYYDTLLEENVIFSSENEKEVEDFFHKYSIENDFEMIGNSRVCKNDINLWLCLGDDFGIK